VAQYTPAIIGLFNIGNYNPQVFCILRLKMLLRQKII